MKYKKPLIYIIFKPVIALYVKLFYHPKFINTEKIPKKGPIIICGNHIHALDPFLAGLSTARIVHFLAKKELFFFPLSLILKSIGTVSVDRSKKDQNAKDMAQSYLNDGRAIVILPEGTRNRTTELLLPFKYGAVSLAKKTGALLVPFAIVGSFKIFSKDLQIIFADPIDISDMKLEDANNLLQKTIKDILEGNL